MLQIGDPLNCITTLSLDKSYLQLGIKDLFSEKADLSDLVAANVKVTSFIHEAKIEVNENGTIAGAATGNISS